jgi:hypothetical protein
MLNLSSVAANGQLMLTSSTYHGFVLSPFQAGGRSQVIAKPPTAESLLPYVAVRLNHVAAGGRRSAETQGAVCTGVRGRIGRNVKPSAQRLASQIHVPVHRNVYV